MQRRTDSDQLDRLQSRRQLRIAIRKIRARFVSLLVDTAFVACLWMFLSYVLANPERGSAPFLPGTWWLMLLASLGIAVIWRAEGSSPGRRLIERYGQDDRSPWYKRSWSLGVVLFLIATFGVAAVFTRVDLVKLFTQADNISSIMKQFFHPDWSVWYTGGQRLIVTLFMALMATLFGMIVALPLSFIAARNLAQGPVARVIYTVVRGFLSFVRSIPAIIWAILFVVWVKSGNAAMGGVMALFVHSVADLTKLYAERLESIDPGPVEAIRATGASHLQVIIYGIVPQIVNPYLSFSIYRLDINVRMSTIIGLVGGGGIGGYLAQTMRVNQYERSIVLMMMIMLTVWSMDTMSARFRERIETGSMPQTPPNYALRMKERIASRIK